jgi:transcriptional regulator with XRE-family HTH domain
MLDKPDNKQIFGRPRGKVTSDTDVKIGLNLLAQRLQRGLSQEKLAEKVDLTFQQIQKYENGKNRISGRRFIQLAEALDCSILVFFAGLIDDAPNPPATLDWIVKSRDFTILHIAEAIADPKQRAAWLALGRTLAGANAEDDA